MEWEIQMHDFYCDIHLYYSGLELNPGYLPGVPVSICRLLVRILMQLLLTYNQGSARDIFLWEVEENSLNFLSI